MLNALPQAELRSGDRLNLFVEETAGADRVLLARIIRQGRRRFSLVRTDTGRFVANAKPALARAFRRTASAALRPQLSVEQLQEPLSGSLRQRLSHLLKSSAMPLSVRKQLFRVAALNGLGFDGRSKRGDHIDLLFRQAPDGSPASDLVYADIDIDGKSHRYYGFRHTAGARPDFYDPDGESMTKFLTRKPVPAGRPGDGFGWRMHPILHVRKFHEGVDYPAPMGSPILAGGDGRVELISWEKGYGRYVRIRHDEGYETTYAHLSGVPSSIKVGERVSQGQVIAYVGSTGYSTGPHLYYELRVNGHYLDPTKQHMRAGRILSGAALAHYDRRRFQVAAILEQFDQTMHNRGCRKGHVVEAGTDGMSTNCTPATTPPSRDFVARGNSSKTPAVLSYSDDDDDDETLMRLRKTFQSALHMPAGAAN